MMNILRRGSRGATVGRWQQFLIGQDHKPGPIDRIFGPTTETATISFQRKHRLREDGIVGNKTCGVAMTFGFGLLSTTNWEEESGPNWPPRPDFRALTSSRDRERLFGHFAYVHEPVTKSPENIRITDNWERDNIISIRIPQLTGIKGAPKRGQVRFHRLAANPVAQLFLRWEEAGLCDRIHTWAGSFVPRFIRGSRSELSNHAFGTAFDINVAWNRLGSIPSLKGQPGCVRELVSIANELGFYWGGHFNSRPDGMHFELAQLDRW